MKGIEVYTSSKIWLDPIVSILWSFILAVIIKTKYHQIYSCIFVFMACLN